MTTTIFEKSIRYDRITRDFRAELDGQLIGFYSSYHAAEETLDDAAYARLTHSDDAAGDSDQDAHTGDDGNAVFGPACTTCDDDGDCPDCAPVLTDLASAQRLAQARANTIKAPTYVVEQNNHYLIHDDADLDCYDAGAEPSIVGTYQPVASDPPVDDGPDDNWGGFRSPLAQTLQGLLDTQARRQCLNCGSDHRTWQCPEVARRLFAPDAPAPWHDRALGKELHWMRWHRYRGFVTLLLCIPAEHLIVYAASYQAYVRDVAPDSTMTINDVLRAWGRMMARDGGRGPAAPALVQQAA
jgi:hypothetical protein